MFVIAVKSKLTTKKAVIVATIAAVLGILITFACISAFSHNPPSSAYCESYGEYSTLAQTDEQVKAFAQQFYEVEKLYSLQEVYVPVKFNDVYEQYNELQKLQGLDLEPYRGEKCRLYMYSLSDFDIDGKQGIMSVIVYRGKVIGGDISNQVKDSTYFTFYGEQVS